MLSKIRLEQAEYRRRQAELKNEELQKKNELDPFTELLNKKTFEDNIQKIDRPITVSVGIALVKEDRLKR